MLQAPAHTHTGNNNNNNNDGDGDGGGGGGDDDASAERKQRAAAAQRRAIWAAMDAEGGSGSSSGSSGSGGGYAGGIGGHADTGAVASALAAALAADTKHTKHGDNNNNNGRGDGEVAAMPLGSELLHCSQLNEAAQELVGHYVTLEEHYMAANVAKAVSMEEVSAGELTSTMVDDVFYILKTSAERAFSICNAATACAVVNHVNALLTGRFAGALQAALQEAASDGGVGSASALACDVS
jgi:hypothetical protein